MSGNRSDELVSHARELDRRDADVAARIDIVAAVQQRVDALRANAGRFGAALEAYPEEIAQAERVELGAREREKEALAELAEAHRRLEEIGGSRRAGNEAKVAAEKALRRAGVAATDAAATVTRNEERSNGLRADHVALQAKAEALAVEVAEVAAEVAELPRVSDTGRALPGSSLVEIEEWGARAHAALFVVRGSLESERERIVQEANALAAAAFGDEVGGMSVALVRRRLEGT
jgi:hypothetical protein